MFPVSTVSSKGWVVIPSELRDRYKLKRGSRVAFVDYGGVLSIVPIPENPVDAGFGLLEGLPLTENLLLSRKEDKTREELRLG
ncbi:AbrB/MazE/SpoVT family DNA-binding domain-containing protein [Desulfovirgula thermocuniculi]|uniref:AbrB/MazE/SpoVT family DNA-binding domain-containing protein n=1 Tax=Desulfovirgula thermocuniculi TaxID=348842 RepID=UPI000482EA1B|nr:AbrB/MazE/SpoVT family DNA-binding domain-containing protein [Desulfovirgula thermocuniculi]